MSKLPSISGRDCAKALEKVGFYEKRSESSHIILRRDEPFAQVVVPDHQELAKGMLRAIIRDADLSILDLRTLQIEHHMGIKLIKIKVLPCLVPKLCLGM